MSKNSIKQNLDAVLGWMESRKLIKKNPKGRLVTPGMEVKSNRRKRR